MPKDDIYFSDNQDEDDNWVSKSAIKRHGKYLREFGQKISNLSEAQIRKFPFENKEITNACLLAKKLKLNSEELRRQQLHIESLLRNDPNLPKYEEAFNSTTFSSISNNLEIHKFEQLRNSLLENGMNEINKLTTEYPQINRQKLINLVNKAKNEIKKDISDKKNYKELFQFLKNLDNLDETND